jgi:GMP synthase-like glutamine amidotransferase
MARATILLSQSIYIEAERNETRDFIDHRLVTFFDSLGFLIVPVPNSLVGEGKSDVSGCDNLVTWINNFEAGGIVLSGGNDIGEFPARDRTESSLLDRAIALNLPVLGICRGMQVIAQRFGSKLSPVADHVCVRHDLAGEINRNVNSYHGKQIADCPDGFRVLATAEDGCIEAIRNDHLNWEGWMWHPERNDIVDDQDRNRILRLFASNS